MLATDPADPSTWRKRYSVKYSTAAGTTGTISVDAADRQYQVGGEILSLNKPQNWTWGSDSKPVNQPLNLNNVTGTISRSRTFTPRLAALVRAEQIRQPTGSLRTWYISTQISRLAVSMDWTRCSK